MGIQGARCQDELNSGRVYFGQHEGGKERVLGGGNK